MGPQCQDRHRCNAPDEATNADPCRIARAVPPLLALTLALVGDITKLPYQVSTAYVTVILDVASSAVVG